MNIKELYQKVDKRLESGRESYNYVIKDIYNKEVYYSKISQKRPYITLIKEDYKLGEK